MDITATKYEPAHKSKPQYWVFTWSLPTATYSSVQGTLWARDIRTSIKKSWQDAKAFIRIDVINSSKPVLEVRGMIWSSRDTEPPSEKAGALLHPTIEDLQEKIRGQARRAALEIVDGEVLTSLELNPLGDEVAAGNWAYSSLDHTILSSSFFGDLEFVYLITMGSKSSNDRKEVIDRMGRWTGENFGWIEYYDGRFGIPSGHFTHISRRK